MAKIIYREKKCPVCGILFVPRSATSKYCSTKCKRGLARCETCGTVFIKKPNTTGRYCSPRCWYKAPGKRLYGERKCQKCGKDFLPKSEKQKYCSPICARQGAIKSREHTHCLNCGKPLRIKASKRTVKFCCRRCALSGQSRRNIKRADIGQCQKGPSGYTLIKVGKKYLGAHKTGWMPEHRYIMERIIGRPLQKHEHIHHKNGKRNDNRPENLELWTIQHKDPPGVRVSDMTPHCPTCTCFKL